MGCLIAMGILILIAILPVGVSAIYDAEGAQVYTTVGVFRIRLLPVKKREKKPNLEQKKHSQKKTATNQKAPEKKGGSISDFLPLLDRVLDFVNAFGRKLRITNLQIKLILAGDDPGDLAQNYGRAWVVLGNLFRVLENSFVIKKRNLEVECDFLADKTTVKARADLSITVGRILSLTLVRGVPVLHELLKIMKMRKGGAKA